MGDEEWRYSVHTKKYLISHQELIEAVEAEIRPGVCSLICKSYDRNMLASYFEKLDSRLFE